MISLVQELVTSDGLVKRWRQPSKDATFYQIRVSLDATPAELDGVTRVDYRIIGPTGTVEAHSTRGHASFRIATWTPVPARIEATLTRPGGEPVTLGDELRLDLPTDDGHSYLEVDLLYAF